MLFYIERAVYCRLAKTRRKIQELNFVLLKNHRTYFIDLKFDVDFDENVLNIGILSILDHTADERNVELENADDKSFI